MRLQNIGLSDLATGTVYPVLSRLEQDGSLTSRLVASTAGPARKYYALSPAGEAALDLSTARWHSLLAIVQTGLSATPKDERIGEDQERTRRPPRPGQSLEFGVVGSPISSCSISRSKRR